MRLPALLALAALLLAAGAEARPCGDDVGGRMVPCACGDVLVSSRTLDERDPVTRGGCAGAGLVVDIPADRPGATLALGGRSLSGSGRGIGIHVVSGGRDGLALEGPGTVRGFDLGVLAPHGQLARATAVLVADNATDGLSAAGTGVAVVDCEASRNGRDGFVLRGRSLHVEGNRALANGRTGFRIVGHDGALGGSRGNEAAGNGRDGFIVRGSGHELVHATATANGASGIAVRVSDGAVADAAADGNRRHGLSGGGRALRVTRSRAGDNGGSGIDVRGVGTADGGGNRAAGNGRETRSRVSECRVGAACR